MAPTDRVSGAPRIGPSGESAQARSGLLGGPLAAVAAMLLASCEPHDSGGRSAITQRDSAGIVIIEHDPARLQATCQLGASPPVSIGSTEGDEASQLYRVFGARRLSDGRIALVNQGSQELRFYGRDGRLVGRTGRQGGGPGEFSDAFHLWVLPGDTVWVGNYRPWRFLVFGPDGQWVRTVQPDPMYVNPPGVIAVLDDGRSVLADRSRDPQPGTAFELRHLTVVTHAPDGSLLDTVDTYPNGRWGRVDRDPQSVMLYPLFESFARVTGAGSRIIVAHTSRAEFSILATADGVRLERIVRWTVGDRSISSAEIEAQRRRLAEPYEGADPATRRRLLDPLVSEDRPIAEQFPAFASLIAGRDGRIWVREYPRPTAPEPQRWLAFADDGRFLCRTTMPAFDEILEFGADYLLIEDRDELGVERVYQYPLGPPTPPD